MVAYTSQTEVDAAHLQLKETFATGLTKSLAWRKWQLKQCWWLLVDNEDRINEALLADLHKHAFESAFELSGVKTDILEHIKHLEEWTGTKPAPGAGFLLGYLGRGRVRKDPLGTALILGAWNFPIAVVIQPLIPAIAAGCCVVLKPSELAPHTSALLAELVPAYLDSRAIRVVTGGPEETTYVLTKRWNQIFYTGSSKVGRIVAAAAAKHLTPVVLELGGQGPCIITKTADVNLAARRLAWLKFLNAGQICICANHVFVEPEVVDAFLERYSFWNKQLLKTTTGETKETGEDQLCHIINERNFDRLAGLLEKTSGEVVYGGLEESSRKSLFIHPTIVNLGHIGKADGPMNDILMSEELFGPITPVITATVEEALRAINSLPEPLALYIFSNDRAVTEHILDNTHSGGVTINNVVFHTSLGDTPFGGVGESGYGSYHGSHGVEQFVHVRPVVEPPSWLDKLMGFVYAPYQNANIGKLQVKNNLGFKRGETLEDQKAGGWFGWYR